jgi:hypothetical protein
MKTKRVEVLFEPKEYKTLEEAARIRGEPVGAVIREAVAKYVVNPREKERVAALRWLASQEMDFDSDWETVKQEIIDARVRSIEKSLETN